MKQIALSTFLFIVTTLNANATNGNYWHYADEPILKKNQKREIVPQKFRNVYLDIKSFQNILFNTPMEFSKPNATNQLLIQLANPSGGIEVFSVFNSPIMENGLAEQFPNIKTYSGQGITNPASTIRFDITDYGFHAQVISPEGTWYIDPYSTQNVNNYIVYFKKDYFNRLKQNFTEDYQYTKQSFTNETVLSSGTCVGTSLRTYRLAIACTGEYAQAVSGTGATVSQVLSKIVTSVNRVDGVFEQEADIHLVLVSTETSVIFTDPSTDPFNGNNNANTLIGESQTVINSNITSANYDIGHTFSTGGGGLANLGCICSNNSKAKGITGSPSPTGDAYDIDYVIHEMGHQFGANHTFNSNLGSCQGNRNSQTAVEVGSGTTIMGYAGICDADDTQPHSDAFFHSISFDEVVTYSNLGNGNNCPVQSNTGNAIPTVTMPESGKTIPMLTPFMLTGGGNDSDGDALTYCWEEMDFGSATTWNGGATTANSPIFKSRIPSTSPTRIFPSMEVIKANYPTSPTATMAGMKGEVLPAVGRTLKFRLTVRDNKSGGGGVATGGNGCSSTAGFNVIVSGIAGPFLVNYPNGGENLLGATFDSIRWDVANTLAAPISCSFVDILCSTDGGNTYLDTIARNVANTGSILCYIPNYATNSNVRVMVKASGNYFFDISNNNFTITHNNSPSAIEKNNLEEGVLKLYPNPTKNNIDFFVNNSLQQNNFQFQITNSLGQSLTTGTFNNNHYTADISSFEPGVYFVKLYSGSKTYFNKFIKE